MFDAYHKWLGIPPSEQPPHHYRLLAIDLFESDPDVISNAADQRMTHLRTFQSGSRSALSQKLLNEIAAARVCLLNPGKKADYDRWLKQRLAATAQNASSPMPQAVSAALPAVGTGPAPRGFSSVAAKYRARRKRNLIATLATVLVMGGFCGALVFLLVRSDLLMEPRRTAPPTPKQTLDSHLPPVSMPPSDDAVARPRAVAKPPAVLPEQASRRIHLQLDAVRKAMAARALTRAEQLLEPARRAAESTDLHGEVDRVGEVLRLLNEFWHAVGAAAARLNDGDPLTIGGVDTVVVEATSEQIRVATDEQSLRYTVRSLPSDVVLNLARRGLSGSESEVNLHVGAFLAVDYRGDRNEARRLWGMAGEQGRRLLPELGLSPPVLSSTGPANGRSQAPMATNGEEPAEPTPQQKYPLPDADPQAAAVSREHLGIAGPASER